MTNESFKGQNTSAEETLRQRSIYRTCTGTDRRKKSNTLGRPLTYCLTNHLDVR